VQRYNSQCLYFILRNDKSFHRRNEDQNYEKVKDFVKFTYQCIFYDPIINVVGLYYFEKFWTLMDNTIDIHNYRPYYAVCIMLASKMWEDRYLTSRDYLKVDLYITHIIGFL
jgi:hypothetical protein